MTKPITFTDFARSVGRETDHITYLVERGMLYGAAIVQTRGLKTLYLNPEIARQQYDAWLENNPQIGRGLDWKIACRQGLDRVNLGKKLRKVGGEIAYTTKPPASLLGFPIRVVDPKTRALIDAALNEGRVTHCPPTCSPEPHQDVRARRAGHAS